MDRIIEVVNEKSFETLVSLLDEVTGFEGPKATMVMDDIMFKQLDKIPLDETQWVEYKSSVGTVKVILKR